MFPWLLINLVYEASLSVFERDPDGNDWVLCFYWLCSANQTHHHLGFRNRPHAITLRMAWIWYRRTVITRLHFLALSWILINLFFDSGLLLLLLAFTIGKTDTWKRFYLSTQRQGLRWDGKRKDMRHRPFGECGDPAWWCSSALW